MIISRKRSLRGCKIEPDVFRSLDSCPVAEALMLSITATIGLQIVHPFFKIPFEKKSLFLEYHDSKTHLFTYFSIYKLLSHEN